MTKRLQLILVGTLLLAGIVWFCSAPVSTLLRAETPSKQPGEAPSQASQTENSATADSAATAIRTPALPPALAATDPRKLPALLEFYAAWCSTCKKMAPLVEAIEKSHAKTLKVVRLDIDDEKNLKYAEAFQVNGTPTYILYDAAGKPVYRMDYYISSTVLETQVDRITGKLPTYRFPTDVAALKAVDVSAKPLVLVAFETENCPVCTQAAPYLEALGQHQEKRFTILRLNEGDAGVLKFKKHLGLSKSPAYAILDNQGHRLFASDGETKLEPLWGQAMLLALGQL